MTLPYSIPENAEVISSIGVALAMVRDAVERTIPNPRKADIIQIKREAKEMAISDGATPDSVEVQIEIDPQTSKVAAIALGSTEVKTTDLLKECSEHEACMIAADSMGVSPEICRLVAQSDSFRVFECEKEDGKTWLRLIDRKGFIKIMLGDARAIVSTAKDAKSVTEQLWEDMATCRSDIKLYPDMYMCIGGRVMDYTGMLELSQLELVMETELDETSDDEQVIIIAGKTDI